jgi:hypothetical protein
VRRFVVLAGLLSGWTIASAATVPPAFHAEFATTPRHVVMGVPAELSFTVRDSAGRAVRFLQFVHERPLHLIVVSSDLSSFAHIHPELGVGDEYAVTHTFRAGGHYRLFADFTPPGSGTRVESFDLPVGGPAPPPQPLVPDLDSTRVVDGMRVTLRFSQPPVANQDILLVVSLADSATGQPIHDLQLYLGALAHVILISADLKDFLHAHPLETGEVFDPSATPGRVHTHDPAALAKVLVGPSPATLRAAVNFPRGGLYKVWVQLQRHGRVSTVPLVVRVGEPPRIAESRVTGRGGAEPALPPGAIKISVSASGYSPARIELPRGKPAVLAFTRPAGGNCGGTVLIPDLDIRRDLPVGQTVLVSLTPREAGEHAFHCAMGMYQGLIVVR